MVKKNETKNSSRTARKAPKNVGPPELGIDMNVDEKPEHRQWIEEAAYYKALNRGFELGREESDWLEAEQEYDAGKPE